MQAEASTLEGESTPKQAGKVRLRTLADLDRRSTATRVVFELRDSISNDLGGRDRLSAMQCELIDNACCLGAMLKDTATRYLLGEPVDLGEFMALTNAQRRLLADLGLERRANSLKKPSLREQMQGAA